jgi:hypothetical protein
MPGNAPPPEYVEEEAIPEGGDGESAAWFKGKVRKERYIELLYNCHPEGGITNLDVVVRDAVPGLGPFELKLESDCVSLPREDFRAMANTIVDNRRFVVWYNQFSRPFARCHDILLSRLPRSDACCPFAS